MPGPIVALEGVRFAYPGGDTVLRDVNLRIEPGDFACLIGPNGGGKSTLMKLMLGLLRPTIGRVLLLGEDPATVRGRIGYMPQQAVFDSQFPVSVVEVVLMGRLGPGAPFGRWSAEDHHHARTALRDVELEGFERRPFADLSGGQRQRVLIARALAGRPEVLMLDEPTSGLDIAVEDRIYELLGRLNEKLTIVMVSHDVDYVAGAVRTAVCVNRTVHVHTPSELSGELIQKLYGRAVRVVHPSVAAPLVSLTTPKGPA